jgi:hypothetical protein
MVIAVVFFALLTPLCNFRVIGSHVWQVLGMLLAAALVGVGVIYALWMFSAAVTTA